MTEEEAREGMEPRIVPQPIRPYGTAKRARKLMYVVREHPEDGVPWYEVLERGRPCFGPTTDGVLAEIIRMRFEKEFDPDADWRRG